VLRETGKREQVQPFFVKRKIYSFPIKMMLGARQTENMHKWSIDACLSFTASLLGELKIQD
jgi:hypothetical protein